MEAFLPRDLPRARSAPMAPRRPPGCPARGVCIAVGAAVDGLLSTRGIWVQADEGASFWAHVCAEPARQGRGGARLIVEGAPPAWERSARGNTGGLTGLPEATRGHLAPVRGPDLRGYHLIRSSMRSAPLQGTTRRAAAAPRRTRTALGEEAALGALEDFAESDPGPAAPRRWRRGRGPRPVHAVPRASRPRGAASCLPHWRGRCPLHQRY